MAFTRPSLTQIIDRMSQDFETRLDQDLPLRRSFLGILIRAISGAAYTIHGHIAWAARQLLPDSADDEYMTRWAAIWGVNRRSAIFAEGNVVFTGTAGTTIAASTQVKRIDGIIYRVLYEGTIAGGQTTITLAVRATEPGENGNVTPGAGLTIVNPIAGISAAAVATGGLSGGTDEEDDDSLRERLLLRVRQPPHGGAEHDYVFWARQVTGVTRVWPTSPAAGAVTVYFMVDGIGNGIPDANKIGQVTAHLDNVVPVGVTINVAAPAAQVIDLSISTRPATTAVKTAIQNGLTDLFYRTGSPNGTVLISQIREVVSVAAGEQDNIVTSPTANIDVPDGSVALLGVIAWTEIP